MSLESRGGSALLLRLFESDFFNVHLAVGYLKTYPGSIGITHYLVQRLRSFDAAEVEFYWPQLCYLVVTRPTPSVALENFILERCEEDPHVAVITLWYLQSSLSDLGATPTTDQFVVCRRVYNRVQAIIFSDPPVPSSSTSGPSVPPVSTITLERPKVNAPLGVLMGMGLMAAGIGMAGLVKQMGQVAIDQSRRVEGISQAREDSEDEEGGSGSDEEGKDVVGRRVEKPLPQTGTALALSKVAGSLIKRKIGGLAAPKRSQTQPPSYLPGPRLEATPPSAIAQSPISTESHSRSLSFLPSPMYPSASTSASRATFARPSVQPVAAPATRRLPRSFDHTTMSSPSLPMAMHSASYLLSPSLPSTSPAGSTLPGYGYPKAFLSHLLLLQSCRTQLDLLRSLQDISTRLVLVPKQARLSSLRAELTVLNHGLPRGCCLGMACGGSSFSTPAGGKKAHARIVRISPSESAVLNSADRAPFVIHVEVLEGDLDFDPDRRQNAEDLRRALREREGGMATMSRRSGQVDPALTRGSFDSGLVRTDEGVLDQRRRGSKVAEDAPPVPPKIITSSPDPSDLSTPHTAEVTIVTTAPVEPVPQEMDLVEQLYGDISIHSAPLPAIPDDPTIQNRSVDEQAWARVASPSPNGTAQVSPAGSRPPSPTTAVKTPRTAVTRTVTSLDDYAERMRMAAIMLAQLDASQAAVIGVVATGTAAAGTLVGLPVATVTGIGGVVGAGLGAVASRLTFHRRDVQAGQASTGVSTVLDTASAASGSSAIAGAPPLLSAVASTPTTPANTPPPPPAQRQRVLSPAEATAIRERIMSEMLALEEERMERMGVDGRARSGWTDGSGGVEDGAVVMRAVNKDDPSGAVFRESFASKTSRIRAASPYGHLATWSVISVIVKTGADLRQEQLAIQLVKEFGRIWDEEKCPSWVRYFRILVTSESTGLIETITDAVSVHSIKKDAYARTAADGTQVFKSFTLYDHYVETFGAPTSASFRKAQDAFVKSLASYSVICYLLSLKDRHNGNILVDRDGHLIHIDFGFLLSNSPGSLGFEMAPFKLPQDYIDILGGFESVKFKEFKTLFKRSFRDARKHAERIITLVELMQKDSNLPCFANGELTSAQLRERFQLTLTQVQADDYVDKLIMNAATSSFTRLYDLFQGYSNGIL